MNSLAMRSDGGAWIVGGGGQILNCSPAGCSSMIPAPTVSWSQAWSGTQNELWAAGIGNTIVYCSGSSCSIKNANNSTTNTLRGLWGSSTDNIIAVGDQGTMLRCSPAASTCTSVLSGTAVTLSSDTLAARRNYGPDGNITVLGIRGSKAVDLLYRIGPDRIGIGSFDIAVVDTPPELRGGSLPGVLLFTPVDGTDAVRNLLTMLHRTPNNTDIMLVRFGCDDRDDWEQHALAIERALGRDMHYLDEPLPRTKHIKQAHDTGRSVWTLPRSGMTLDFLCGVETLAQTAWERARPRHPWPLPPPQLATAAYVPGWDDDE